MVSSLTDLNLGCPRFEANRERNCIHVFLHLLQLYLDFCSRVRHSGLHTTTQVPCHRWERGLTGRSVMGKWERPLCTHRCSQQTPSSQWSDVEGLVSASRGSLQPLSPSGLCHWCTVDSLGDSVLPGHSASPSSPSGQLLLPGTPSSITLALIPHVG